MDYDKVYGFDSVVGDRMNLHATGGSPNTRRLTTALDGVLVVHGPWAHAPG
jgi:hypothetical protein